MNSTINFYKTMSWGGTVTQAFSFIRTHIRVFLLGNLYYVFPCFFAYFLLSSFLKNAIIYNSSSNIFENIFPYSGITIFLMLMLMLIGTSMAISVNGNIIRTAFLNNNQRVTLSDVQKNLLQEVLMNALYILMFILLFIIFSIGAYVVILIGSFTAVAIAAFLGAIGVVLMVIFAALLYSFIVSYMFSCIGMIFIIQNVERKGIFEALGRNFHLIHCHKKNFWGGVITSFLIFIVLQVLSLSLNWPVMLIAGLVEFTSGDLPTSLLGLTNLLARFDYLFSLSSTVTIPLWILVNYICVAFLYFNLSERADSRGLKKRISEIGQRDNFDKDLYNKIV